MVLGTLPSLLFVFGAVITMASEAAAAGRSFPPKESTAKKDDVKHPEWLFGHHDGSFLIPGIGRVLAPPAYGCSPHSPSVGSTGGTGSTGAGANHNYVPGGDDTLVPNPGVEVPNPGRGGGGGGHVP